MASHASRVRETSTTTGTGTLSLAGAVSGYRTFVAGIGNGRSAFYTIRNRDVPTEWEVGVGIVTDASTDTLSRATVIRSSNSGALVNFSAGTKDVYISVGEEAMNRLQQIPLRVKVATTANITLSATQTIDGVSAAVGDRVLVKDQSTASQNGIYVVASGSWTRAVDCATGDPASCMLVLVDQGTVGANTAWLCTTNSGSDVVGTNSLAFSRIDSQAITGTAAGILCSDGAGTINPRTLTAPAAGITVSNGTGAAGNPTLALANDLSAVEGLSGTGIAARTASDTWATRTITGGTGVTVTNGGGVAGNPTVAIGQAVGTTDSVRFFRIGVDFDPTTNFGLACIPSLYGSGNHYGTFCAAYTMTDTPPIFAGLVTQCVTQPTGAAKTYPDIRGAWFASNTKTQAGDAVTVNTGVYISDQTIGATNYAIYTGAGKVRFGDIIVTASAQESTGSGSAALGSNCPAVTTSAPYKWLKFETSDGSTVYVPAWK